MVMQNLWEKQAKKAKSVQIVSNTFKKVATIEDETSRGKGKVGWVD